MPVVSSSCWFYCISQHHRKAGSEAIRLTPELYAHLNRMPFEAAAEMEKDLAEDSRRAGYEVTRGH